MGRTIRIYMNSNFSDKVKDFLSYSDVFLVAYTTFFMLGDVKYIIYLCQYVAVFVIDCKKGENVPNCIYAQKISVA